MMNQQNANQLAAQLLLAVKMQKSTSDLTTVIANLSIDQLKEHLKSDAQKKAFWINAYNAYFQILRKEQQLDKPRIYKDQTVTISGQLFSLDDMEHGILRKFQYKALPDYLNDVSLVEMIKTLAVDELDYRIHFALNCGAKSCPPIAFYNADRIDQQLEMATLSFLEGDSDIDTEKKELHVSQLFQWFNNDFGGAAGVLKILSERLDIDANTFKIIYNPYSWEEALDNWNE